MKLKPILLSTVLAGSGVAFGVIAEDSLDYAKINKVINSTIADVVQNYDKVKAFTYELIEGTDVDLDQYVVDLSLTIDKGKGKGPVTVDGTVSFELAREGKSEALSFGVEANVALSAVDVAKHAAEKWECPVANDLAGVKRISSEEDCKIVNDLLAATTIDDLQAIVERHVADLKAAFSAFASQSGLDLSSIHNLAARKLLEAELEKAQKIRDWLDTVEITKIEDGFTFTAGAYQKSEKLTIDSFTMTMTSDSFEVGVEVTTPVGVKFYKAFKPEVVKLLRDLQTGEQYAVELLKLDVRGWLNLLEMYLEHD